MRYGIIGTGAIGGFYGARLAKAGQEVHFLLHNDYDYVLRHGLEVHSWQGDFKLEHPNVYRDTHEMPPCDVVLVGLKTTNNRLLPDLLPPLLHDKTLVVLIQNGIGVEADVQQMFPNVSLAAGLAFICSSKSEPGVVRHQHYGSINIGNYSCRDTSLIDKLLAELREAGIEVNLVDYETARWRKAVWNMPFNGMTVALGCQTLDLMQHPLSRRLIWEQMMEVVHAAQAMGVPGLDVSTRVLCSWHVRPVALCHDWRCWRPNFASCRIIDENKHFFCSALDFFSYLYPMNICSRYHGNKERVDFAAYHG